MDFKSFNVNDFSLVDIPLNTFYYVDSGYNYVFDSSELKILFFKVVNVCIKDKKSSVDIDKYFLFLGDNIDLYKVDSYNNHNFELSRIDLNLDFDSELAKINELNLELKKDMSNSMIIDMVRRYLELNKAKDGFNILDGSLDIRYAFEKSLVEKFKIGFSKKSNFNKMISKQGYVKLKENSVIAKLFDNSEYCFRIDYKDDLNLVLSILVDQSDNIFKGYPYGLILADKFAKVSSSEKEMLNMMMFILSNNKEKFFALMSQSNAHDIIDIINRK